MIKGKHVNRSHVVLFVEGDTDELMFRALIEYYKSISKTDLNPCSICNLRGVTRYSSKLLAKLKNDYLPEAKKEGYLIQTVCCSYDTDVFEERNPLIISWESLQKAVKRLGISGFIRIGVCSSIEDWILDDIEGVCRYLKLYTHPKSIKGSNGAARLNYLFNQAKRTYQKGYVTRDLVHTLDFATIRMKHEKELILLEKALGVNDGHGVKFE